MVCARFSTKLLTHAQDGQAQYYGNTATNSNQEELQDSLADVGFAHYFRFHQTHNLIEFIFYCVGTVTRLTPNISESPL